MEDAPISKVGNINRWCSFTDVYILLHHVEYLDIRFAFRKPIVILLIGSNDVRLIEFEKELGLWYNVL